MLMPRDVAVTVFLDSSQQMAQYSSATYLHNHGVPVFFDDAHAVAHDKVILIDGSTDITGSFNFSVVAEDRNAENVIIIRDEAELNAAYAANFALHLAYSEKYQGMNR